MSQERGEHLERVGFLDMVRSLSEPCTPPDWLTTIPPTDPLILPDDVSVCDLLDLAYGTDRAWKKDIRDPQVPVAYKFLAFVHDNGIFHAYTAHIRNALHHLTTPSVDLRWNTAHQYAANATLGDLRRATLDDLKQIDGLRTGYYAELIKKLFPSPTS